MYLKVLAGLVLLGLLTFQAQAAIIKGNIYDLELNLLKDAIVEISTKPKQVYVAKNASYAFEVGLGSYHLSALHPGLNISDSENISIEQDGTYTIDLILMPSLEEELGLISEVEEVAIEERKPLPLLPISIALAAAAAAFALIALSKRKEEELTEDLLDVLRLLHKEGGRTTQKELRKAVPWSEAKVSLMLEELAAKGFIEKIARGKGNIVLLKAKGLKAIAGEQK